MAFKSNDCDSFSVVTWIWSSGVSSRILEEGHIQRKSLLTNKYDGARVKPRVVSEQSYAAKNVETVRLVRNEANIRFTSIDVKL